MKLTKLIAITFVILLTLTACSKEQEDNRTVIKEPEKSITVIDNEEITPELPVITVEKIDQYKGAEITDWLDEQTVVLAKVNNDFDKMSLLEKSEFYPRSLYLYQLDNKEYKVLKAVKNMFFGGATLSPDKKHMLYYEYSIGDTAHYLMNLEEGKQNTVKEETLGLAITARWADAYTVIGTSYAGGAYMADTNRNLTPIEELQEEQLYTVVKSQDKIYYITIGDTLQLHMLDLATGEKRNLNIDNADQIIPSPDGKQLLITQWTETSKKLLVADTEGNILRTIVEGTDVTGTSWSPDQQMIAYQYNTVNNGAEIKGLFVYDVMTGKSIQIAVNIENAKISWSPSGKKIAVAEYGDSGYNSSIIYLK